MYHTNISGHSVGQSINTITKPAFGEYYERINLISQKNGHLKSFRLSTGTQIKVDAQKILFTGKIFNDSSGVAAHVSSEKLIQNSFLEFIERQSLIFTWLNKTPGQIIDLRNLDINYQSLQNKIEILNNFVDTVTLVNISISPSIYVVLGIGTGKTYKSIGLSAHWNLETAIDSTLTEMIQFFGVTHNKNVSMQEKKQNITYNNPYMSYFHNLTIKDLIKKYEFLFNNKKKINLASVTDKSISISNLIAIIEKDLNIGIFITFIPVKFGKNIFKVAKVFSPEGYPHMNVPLLNDEERTKYSVVNIKNQNIEPIPFP